MADKFVSLLLMHLYDRLDAVDGGPGDQMWRKIRMKLGEIYDLVVEVDHLFGNIIAAERFLAEVKDVAYDAEDLIDDYTACFLKNKVYSLKTKLNNCFSPGSRILFRSKIRELEVRLSGVVHTCQTQSSDFLLRSESDGDDSYLALPHTVSLIDEFEVFGRDSDREAIVKLLLEGARDANRFSVVSIVGMEGIGKTTLAQLAYDDERVVGHFSLRAWVSLADKFDMVTVLRRILEAANIKQLENSSLDALGRRLVEVLRGKRFLIVLDHMWSGDREDWSMLRTLFKIGALGSKVLLTTNIASVAVSAGGIPSYRLGFLSHKDSWALFKSISLSPFPDKDNTNLEEIGRRIVQKCFGLPLAVKAVAGLLRFKRKEIEWLSVLHDDAWERGEHTYGRGVLPALKLSYSHLPLHLKPCFAFCSVFPINYTINKTKLIQCWIANGFVRSTIKSRSLEEAGDDYFDGLWKRSFFIDVASDEFENVVEFRMHHLIHEFARSVAGAWCAVVENGVPQNLSSFQLHHSSLLCLSGESSIPEELYHVKNYVPKKNQAKNLRTLLLLSGKLRNIPSILKVSRFLRVLDLSCSDLHEVPVSVSQLIHLRYLDLSRTHIKTLPRSIRKLKFLKILELSECYNLYKLPNEVSELTNIIYLGIQSCPLLSHMPYGIGKLRLLQILPTFILGENDGCGCLSDLSGLNLRGRLEIKNLEHARDPVEAHGVKLYVKPCLYSLGLSWDQNLDTRMSFAVLESLRPSQYVEVLDIIGYGGLQFPSWLWDNKMRLVKLSLINCSCQKLPPLGQLPNLRHLHMKNLSEVHIIGHEFYGYQIVGGFLSLKELEVYDLPNLSEWMSCKLPNVSFPCVETLSIKGCTRLTELPSLPSLRKLALSNCNTALLGSLTHLTSLSSLVIDEFREPMPLSTKMGKLNSIETLTIYDCDDLISLMDESLHGFTSLEHLSILSCDKLEYLPVGLRYLTSLQKLKIVDCQELVNVPDISDLSSRPEIVVEGCPNLISLPEEDSIESVSLKKGR